MITLDEQIEWVERTLNRAHLSDYQTLTDILATLRAVKQAEPVGEVCVTTNEQAQVVAVTRVDEDNRILSVIWEAPHPAPAPDGWVLVPKEPTPEQINAMRVYEIVTDRGTTLLDRDEAQDIYRAMLAAAPAAPQSGWVSVEERLPEDGVWVKVRTDKGDEIKAVHARGYWWDMPIHGSDLTDNVTHWMPLPAAPGSKSQ